MACKARSRMELANFQVNRKLAAAEADFQRRLGAALRPLQRETLTHLAQGGHVFANLPTGYGKSACYWLPASAWGWKVWVLSPLVSLIEDQALACRALGVSYVAWTASNTKEEKKNSENRLESGDWQVCLLSPERFLRWTENGYLAALRSLGQGPDLLVVDEMHCLEEWRGFRDGYKGLFEELNRICGRGPGTQLLGLSASLAEKDGRAWMEELCGTHNFVGGGLGRENLSLKIWPLEEERERWLILVSALKDLHAPESALVYCGTRRETDEVASWLCSAGFAAVAYHAGLPGEMRSARSRAFREGRTRVVCATSAFGMGVDYPHVSRVIHFSLPHDLESYWQEVGRAGRGGGEAMGIALWRRSEIKRARIMRNDKAARERFVAMWRAWMSGNCRKQAIATRLGLREVPCGNCDRCDGTTARVWWLEPEATPLEWLEESTR